MSRQDVFGWSYPAGCSGPPEDDWPAFCDVCNLDASDCECPECPVCQTNGDPQCYEKHDLEPAHDSVASLCRHIGVAETISNTLRAIEKHNVEHVWIVTKYGDKVYYNDDKKLEAIMPWERLSKVGVGGIAWDGSDWEYGAEVEAGYGWSALDKERANFEDALEEHRLLTAKEEA